MSQFQAPVQDMRFVLDEIVGLAEIAELPGYEEATPDLVDAVLDEAARFSAEVLAPLNRVGDLKGCQLTGVGVRSTAVRQVFWRGG